MKKRIISAIRREAWFLTRAALFWEQVRESEGTIKIYLASPYSHDSAAVREARTVAVREAATMLMDEGFVVFSPVSHSHELSGLNGSQLDHDLWLKQDLALMPIFDVVLVLKLPGWENSRGVKAEIAEAKRRGIHVLYWDIFESEDKQ